MAWAIGVLLVAAAVFVVAVILSWRAAISGWAPVCGWDVSTIGSCSGGAVR